MEVPLRSRRMVKTVCKCHFSSLYYNHRQKCWEGCPFYLFFSFLPPPLAFRAEKRSAQASAHPLSQAQGGLFSDCVRLFVCLSLTESLTKMKCTRCERLLLEKPLYFCAVFVFRHLKITLDSEQPMLKEKRIILSV